LTIESESESTRIVEVAVKSQFTYLGPVIWTHKLGLFGGIYEVFLYRNWFDVCIVATSVILRIVLVKVGNELDCLILRAVGLFLKSSEHVDEFGALFGPRGVV
jgi:hypothetical protein